MNLTAISLFAGVGGICLGFKKNGVEIVYANDFDKNACQTYRANFSHLLFEGDIKSIDVNTIPDADFLLGGSPCQAFSIAGYQKGFDDERGNLFFEYLRILKAKQPKVFFFENVKNLVSHDNGRTFAIMLKSFQDEGYFVKNKVLNACEYGNIPQNRERIYVVGFQNKEQFEKFNFPEKIPLTKTIHDIISKEKQNDKYYYTNAKMIDLLKQEITDKNSIYQYRRVYVRKNKSNLCPTLTANMGTGGHNVPLILDDYGIRKLTPRECFFISRFSKKFCFTKNQRLPFIQTSRK